MKTLRDEFYFEPRVIGTGGEIHWYGELYRGGRLLEHTEETVYIRDSGKELFIYNLDSDQLRQEERIKAVFTLICRMEKNKRGYRYGKRC